MKHKSFYRRSNISLLLILVMYIAQIISLLYQFNSGHPVEQIINDSKNILFSFLILFVIYYIAIMISQPLKMKKSVKQIKHVLDEFKKGNYEYDIDNLYENIEKEYLPLLDSLKRMLANIIQFDKLKEAKIFSHHSKLKGLTALTNDGTMIIEKSGEILYINEVMISNFGHLELDEDTNFLETYFPDSFEKSIKKYVKEVLVKGVKKEPCTLVIPDIEKQITIKSSLFKSRSGDFLGGIFLITDLQPINDEENEELISKIIKKVE